MLDIRQKEEICCSCHYTESSSKSLSEFMQKKSVSGTGLCDWGGGMVVLVVCKRSAFTLSVK